MMRPPPITVAAVEHVVARHYGLRRDEIRGRRRSRSIARARHVAMTLAREYTGASLPEIGAFFGGRHHTSVMHALRTVEQRESVDERLRRELLGFRCALDVATGRAT